MTEAERTTFDPYSMDCCGYQLCQKPSAIACPVCGWTYCLEHWDDRMHAVHARLHAEQEMLSTASRARQAAR